MNLPLAPLIAAVLGGAAALGVVAMPVDLLESLVTDSSLPSVIAAAEPPLGITARALLALGAGGLVAAFAWLSLFILIGTRGVSLGEAAEPKPAIDEEDLRAPVLRRADAHPDAPPRPPLLATRDLGTPFLEVRAAQPEGGAADEAVLELTAPPAEQPLPHDLGQPLAAFDPAAIPETPLAAPLPITPLRHAPKPPVFEPRERFETFELTPPVRPAPRPVPMPAPKPRRAAASVQQEPIARPETEASVHALLERLEQGVVRKGLASGSERHQRPRDAERGLEEALVTLRNLARRA